MGSQRLGLERILNFVYFSPLLLLNSLLQYPHKMVISFIYILTEQQGIYFSQEQVILSLHHYDCMKILP